MDDFLSFYKHLSGKFLNTQELQKCAKKLMGGHRIVKGNLYYQIAEIEFYFYSPQHPDIITYPRNCMEGLWFFHSSGVDITTKSNNEEYGGVLIRSIIRNDGTVLKCDSFHPYIKEGNMNVNEFFYESAFDVSLNLFHEESKQQSVIKGIEALVNSFIHYHKDLKKDADSHLKFNYSNGKIFDDSKLDLLYDKLDDLTNQEFCRVRTSSEYGSGGNSKDIYVRISSDNFDFLFDETNKPT